MEIDSKDVKSMSAFFRSLYYIDEVDKKYSSYLQEHTSVYANAILCVPAHLFNRGNIVITLTFSLFVGALTYNTWLENLGYQRIERDVSPLEQARFGLIFMLTYIAALVALVISVQTAKYTIKRPRPNRLPNTPRWGKDLRAHENGTFSMPSGDSAAGTIFATLYTMMLGIPSINIVIPLVMAGRVYYQCHWFGDTVIGTAVGGFWAWIIVTYFGMFQPVMSFIAAQPDAFVPAVAAL